MWLCEFTASPVLFPASTPSSFASSCSNSSATSNFSRPSPATAVHRIAFSGDGSHDYEALLDEPSSMDLLVSSDVNVVYAMLTKISNSIQHIHQEMGSLCAEKAGVDHSFRSRVSSGYLGLLCITRISEIGVAPHPDNLFVILRIYMSLTDLFGLAKQKFLSILDKLSLENAYSVCSRFDNTFLVLRSTVRITLQALRIRIADYISEDLPQGGAIHEITKYLMKYIKLLLEHAYFLSAIFAVRDKQEAVGVSRRETLNDIVAALISNWQTMLNKNAGLYGVPELQCMFLVNNMYFILQQVEGSKMISQFVLGDDWVLKQRNQLERYISRYLDISWAPICSCLHIKSNKLHVWFGEPALSKFTRDFHKTYSTQRSWKVEDPLLRKHMRRAVIKEVVPAYRSYLEKHQTNPPKFKYTPGDLEEKLSELFEG